MCIVVVKPVFRTHRGKEYVGWNDRRKRLRYVEFWNVYLNGLSRAGPANKQLWLALAR